MNCNGTMLGCGTRGQERMVASLSVFWGEECQNLVELGKYMDRFPVSKGAEAEKTLTLDRGEREKCPMLVSGFCHLSALEERADQGHTCFSSASGQTRSNSN